VARDSPLQSPPSNNTAMLVAAARRFGVLLGATAAAITVCSIAVGALVGASLNRSIATGFEGFGALLLVFGFFVGNRGPVRVKGDAAPFFGPRFLRWATPEEFQSTIADSAIFIVLGLVLILFGLAIDSRYRLF
jgi:uncharacterized membrane protein